MPSRRSFLAALASVPFLGWLAPKAKAEPTGSILAMKPETCRPEIEPGKLLWLKPGEDVTRYSQHMNETTVEPCGFECETVAGAPCANPEPLYYETQYEGTYRNGVWMMPGRTRWRAVYADGTRGMWYYRHPAGC